MAASFTCTVLLLLFHSAAGNASVSTPLGVINGVTERVAFQENTYEVDKYLGIPFAKAPLGELRFKKPLPYGTFSEPYNATEDPPACPQYDSYNLGKPLGKRSEDCLFLNVYVPRQKPDEKSGHAVMVFIHGGGYAVGAGHMFESEVFASVGNVITVTINYRLGLLGFMDLDDGTSAGNFGLWDQRLALQWVNENVESFGGVKDRVTVFGSSGGAVCTLLHMMYPPNKGLFRGAITQSGALVVPTAFQKNNKETAKHYARYLGCRYENQDDIFHCLKSATPENIIKVNSDVIAAGDMEAAMKLIISPTIDGEYVKKHPTDLYKLAESEPQSEIEFFRSLKLINGINGAEGALFIMMMGRPEDLDQLEITREQINNHHIPGAISQIYGADKKVPDSVKQLLIAEYTDWDSPDDPKRLREQVLRLNGDTYFNVPGIEMSRIHANASNVDSYVYNFIPQLHKRSLPTPAWVKKAVHGDEIAPLFGYNFAIYKDKTDLPPQWEYDLSRRMITYWTNFAKSGDPNKPVRNASPSLIWPKYSITSQQYMILDKEDSVSQFLYAREFAFWRNTLPALFREAEHAQTLTSEYGNQVDESCEKDGNCDGG